MLYKRLSNKRNQDRREECYVCGSLSSGALPVCCECMANMPRHRPAEQRKEPPIDGIKLVWTPFKYAYPLDRLITAAKFRGDLAAMHVLSFLLAEEARKETPMNRTGLIPIPLHWHRLVKRGFNQAGVLADAVGRELGITVIRDVGFRSRRTVAQAMLSAAERKTNIDSAFLIKTRAVTDEITIIDDVVTTGATARSFAEALHEAGYKRVNLWALARA